MTKLIKQDKKKTLAQRVKDLEYLVYKEYVEECSRYHLRSMSGWQQGIYNMRAYRKCDNL